MSRHALWPRHERLRKRFERRVRDSHRRWQVLSNLELRRYVSWDGGMLLLKSGEFDLYIAASQGSPYRAEHVHPSWLAGR